MLPRSGLGGSSRVQMPQTRLSVLSSMSRTEGARRHQHVRACSCGEPLLKMKEATFSDSKKEEDDKHKHINTGMDEKTRMRERERETEVRFGVRVLCKC